MNIGIIGAGFTGLSAALELQKKGHIVTLFEKESIPGGLAIGFQNPEWEWSLEKHYHHIFTSDVDIISMAEEVGVKFSFSYPSTSWLIDNGIYRVDSATRLLLFKKLSIIDRLRMAAVLGLFKIMPYTNWLEQVTAHDWLTKWMGKPAYEMFWEPLLESKFGEYKHEIALSWFWARIKARSPELGYPEGGFQRLAEAAAKKIQEQGGKILYSSTVSNLQEKDGTIRISTQEKEIYIFDKVLVTLPNFFFGKMAQQLPVDYQKELVSFKGIGALNMVLEMDAPFFNSDVYWLSICQKEYPFLAVVEHTNFIDKKHYNNRHLVYVGNYLPKDHTYFSLSKEELLQEYDVYLKKLNPNYAKHIVKSYVFPVSFAQPIVSTNYSKKILSHETPLKNVYLANMQQVYPWDRGTNFAVEMGKSVAKKMTE